MTRDQTIRAVQSHLGIPVDGKAGDITWGAIYDALGVKSVTDPIIVRPDSQFPNPDYDSMYDFYGYPGDPANLTTIEFPYPMRLYTRQAKPDYRKNFGIHRKLKDSLERVLSTILEVKGYEWIVKHGLDVFGGIFNDRSVRGGTSKSKHSWGAAIDLNPAENRNRQPWHPDKIGQAGYANMPLEAVEIFERFGWMSGGREWGRDAMHFQATNR